MRFFLVRLANNSLKLTRLSPRLYLRGWAESERVKGRLTDERHELTARFVSSLVPFSHQPGDAREDIVLIRAQHAPAKPTNNSLNQTLLLSVQLRFDGKQGHRHTVVRTIDPQGRLARAVRPLFESQRHCQGEAL